jgi:hypothetical protein
LITQELEQQGVNNMRTVRIQIILVGLMLLGGFGCGQKKQVMCIDYRLGTAPTQASSVANLETLCNNGSSAVNRYQYELSREGLTMREINSSGNLTGVYYRYVDFRGAINPDQQCNKTLLESKLQQAPTSVTQYEWRLIETNDRQLQSWNLCYDFIVSKFSAQYEGLLKKVSGNVIQEDDKAAKFTYFVQF